MRTRRSPEFIAAMVEDPQRTLPGSSMPRTEMPDNERALIIRYLQSRPGDASSTTGAKPSAAPVPTAGASGEALYARWCAGCHGTAGRGDGPNASSLPVTPANHADATAMSARPDDSLFDTIAGGGAIMNRSPRMPAFGATLSPSDMRALVSHIRRLCRCEGPEWSRNTSGSR
ncbi:MAG: cytochrome c [Gemmatimonadaceae bacterium]